MRAPTLLSIVVPVHDREATISRCLDSVFAQDFSDFEIVAVDDGSTDRSREIMEAVADPRFRLVVHAANRGVCPARNTGIAASAAPWIVFLDSDDELAGAGALGRMADAARAAPDAIAALWFRSRLDDGSVVPAPSHASHDWDYRGYLRFLEATHGAGRDMIRCVRRRCFASLRYPESRMLEEKFHLDFARMFASRLHDDVLRLYHQDAGNRLVDRVGRLDPVRDAAFVADRADGLSALLEMHGAALSRHAPRVYRDLARRAARQALLAGFFPRAWRQAVGVWVRRPIDARAAALALLAAFAWLAAGRRSLVAPGGVTLARQGLAPR